MSGLNNNIICAFVIMCWHLNELVCDYKFGVWIVSCFLFTIDHACLESTKV
jgi:hypothetical protein